jgi:hypothetical protein
MNFYPYFPSLLSLLAEILHKILHVTLLHTSNFRKKKSAWQRWHFADRPIYEITLRPVLKTCWM